MMSKWGWGMLLTVGGLSCGQPVVVGLADRSQRSPPFAPRSIARAMRLLLIHPWAGSPSRQELYIELQERTGWDLRIVTAKRWRDDYARMVVATRAPRLEGELVALPVGLSGNIPLHFFKSRLRHYIREFAPDCVYIYHEPYAVVTWQVLQAAKAVTSAPVGVRSSQNVSKRYPLPFRWMERSVYRRSDFAVVVTDNVAAVMRGKGYAKPIHVVPMPVDVALFVPGDPPTESAQLRIGYVGRLVPEKGVDTALKALAALAPGSATLTVVGDGPQGGELRQLADDLGVGRSVTWRGSLDRGATAAAYQDIDVVVVASRATPSWQEQFGRVVIEAAAAGVAAIVTRSGELPYLVASLGAGWTVEEDDSVGMAEILTGCCDDRAALRQAGATARREVVAKYADEVIVGQLVAAFEAAVKSGGRA
jgi:glycosyltransferase involved in cell wall biosynthesis